MTAAELDALRLSLIDRAAQRAGQPAFRDRDRVGADARRLRGRVLSRCVRASAAGAAAGRRRLSAAAGVRHARPDRAAGCIEQFGIQLVFTSAGAALATAVMTFPLMVRAIRISLEGVDPGLEDAARTLGAGAWDRFFTITLPLMLPGHSGRRGDGVCRGARRVRRGDHVRVQHSRRDAHAAARALHGIADAGR